MTVKKINLSALNKESQAEISDFMKSQETHPNEVIKNEKTLETKTEEIQETNIVKKKISLKDIKKSSNIITKNISQDIEKEEIEGGNSQEVVEFKVEEKEEVKDNQEEKTNLESEIKVIQIWITDGDTNCNIIKEEKSELFLNYKWSFSEEIKLPEKKEEIEGENSQEVVEFKVEEKEEVKDNQEEKTNLERYSEGEKLVRKNKYKKVIISSLITMFCFIIWFWAYFLSWKINIKWNLAENKNNKITVINEYNDWTMEVIKHNNLSIEEVKQKENEVFWNETISEVKNDIVNESVENQVDNTTNSNTIKQKLKNHLIQKYKSK